MEKDAIYLLFLLFVGRYFLVKTEYKAEKALEGQCFTNHTFRQFPVTQVTDCFIGCMENCLCVAFQLLNRTVCELLSITRHQRPSSIKTRPGCEHYDTFPNVGPQHCGITRSCCLAGPNPCPDDLICGDLISTNVTKEPRYKCYHPTSCKDHIHGSRLPEKYKVFDSGLNPYEVFCDFDNHAGPMAWTLILSYTLQNKYQVGLGVDAPLDQLWSNYRLSKSRIELLIGESRKWRFTCSYDTDGLVYTDYARFAIDTINPFTYNSANAYGCFQAEYINIRGYDCSQCTTPLGQDSSYLMCMDTSAAGCSFVPGNPPSCHSTMGEDAFGWYKCVGPQHRCASSQNSTTQIWFGGN